MNYDVVARGLFNAPFRGAVPEVVQFSMVLIVFLQLPDVVRMNRLTRSDGFLTILSSAIETSRHFFRQPINFVSAVFMVLVAYAIWPEFVEMYETLRLFRHVPGIFTAPWWPIKLAIASAERSALCIFLFKVFSVILPDPEEPVRLGRTRRGRRA